MGKTYASGATATQNKYNPTIAAPFDVRSVVTNKADLHNSATFLTSGVNSAYTGMVVAVVGDSTSSNNGLYQLTDKNDLDNGWVKIADKNYVDSSISAATSVIGDLVTELSTNVDELTTAVDITLPTLINNKADKFELGNGLTYDTDTIPKTLNLNLNQLRIGTDTYSLVAGDAPVIIDIPTSSGTSGTTDYTQLSNKPYINRTQLTQTTAASSLSLFQYYYILENWNQYSKLNDTAACINNVLNVNKGIVVLKSITDFVPEVHIVYKDTTTEREYFRDRGTIIGNGFQGDDATGLYGILIDGTDTYTIESTASIDGNVIDMYVSKLPSAFLNNYIKSDREGSLDDNITSVISGQEWYNYLNPATLQDGIYHIGGSNLVFKYNNSALANTSGILYICNYNNSAGNDLSMVILPNGIFTTLQNVNDIYYNSSTQKCEITLRDGLDYSKLTNKPTINGIALTGDLTSDNVRLAKENPLTLIKYTNGNDNEYYIVFKEQSTTGLTTSFLKIYNSVSGEIDAALDDIYQILINNITKLLNCSVIETMNEPNLLTIENNCYYKGMISDIIYQKNTTIDLVTPGTEIDSIIIKYNRVEDTFNNQSLDSLDGITCGLIIRRQYQPSTSTTYSITEIA